jgi:hypothetical protein
MTKISAFSGLEQTNAGPGCILRPQLLQMGQPARGQTTQTL